MKGCTSINDLSKGPNTPMKFRGRGLCQRIKGINYPSATHTRCLFLIKELMINTRKSSKASTSYLWALRVIVYDVFAKQIRESNSLRHVS